MGGANGGGRRGEPTDVKPMEVKPTEATVVLAEATTLAEQRRRADRGDDASEAVTVAVAEANGTSGGSDGRRQQLR